MEVFLCPKTSDKKDVSGGLLLVTRWSDGFSSARMAADGRSHCQTAINKPPETSFLSDVLWHKNTSILAKVLGGFFILTISAKTGPYFCPMIFIIKTMLWAAY